MILKRFLKPKWQHSDPETRKQSLLKLNPDHKDSAHILEQLSLDPHPDVAHMAIDRIHDVQVLNKQLSVSESESTQQALIHRIVAMFCEDHSASFGEIEKLAFLGNCQQQMLLTNLACLAPHQPIQLAALSNISSEEELAAIAGQSNSPAVRLAAAKMVHRYDLLASLSKQVRGRDKVVYRLVKDRLTIENTKRAEQIQSIQLRDQLLDTVFELANKPYFPQYPQKFALLQQQWNEIDTQFRNEEVDTKFQQASQGCQALILEEKAKAQQLLQARAASNDFIKAHQALEHHLDQLKCLIPIEPIDLAANAALLEEQQTLWRAAGTLATPPATLLKKFNLVSNDYERTIKALQRYQTHLGQLNQLCVQNGEPQQASDLRGLLTEISWPQSTPKPNPLDRATNILNDKKKIQEENRLDVQTELNAIKTKLRSLSNAIEKGSLKAANQLHKEIHQAEKEGALDQSKSTHQQFIRLAGQLKELNGWQGFSSANKKTELCEKMEALISHPCDPDDKAKQIQLLQEQWKQSGPSNSQSLWVRFKSASDIAYEPCKEFFAQNAQTRQHNLRERELICQQLDQFIGGNDWGNANWPAAQEISRTAKQQWKSFSPVDRAKGNVVQKEFNGLLRKLEQLIQAEQTRNIEKKEAIVNEAENLFSLDNENEAIEKAKQLQSTWKTIGITPRKKDEKLWKLFRKHCDMIFERRDHLRRSAQDEQEGQLNQAVALCEQLENAAKAPAESLLEFPRLPAQIDKEFKALNILAKEKFASLRKRYLKAVETFSVQLALAKTSQQQKQLQRVRDLSIWLNNGAQQSGNLTTEQLQQKWETLSEGIPDSWAAPFLKRFQAILTKETTTTENEHQSTNKIKSLLCIRMEILAGLDSPEEAKAERMAYQVDRLSKEMKSTKDQSLQSQNFTPSTIDTAIEIELKWLEISRNNLPEALDQRFELARVHLWTEHCTGTTSSTTHQQELESSL